MASKKASQEPKSKSALLKLKLKELLAKLPRLDRAKKNLTTLLSAVVLLSSFGYISLKTPELHGLFLRYKVGSKVYMIKGSMNGGGGTGFAMKAASGQSYIVTNSHVCEYAVSESEDKATVLVVNDEGVMRRRVLEISDKSDLCLIEGLPNVTGLSLGEEPSIGQIVTSVGHPRLRPTSLSKGEIVGAHDVKIVDFVMPTGDALADMMLGAREGKCDKPKNEIVEVPVTFMGEVVGTVKVCLVVTKAAYMSTVVIHPGNSGSPIVDNSGNVVGVAFAADSTNWAEIVSLKDLEQLLSRY